MSRSISPSPCCLLRPPSSRGMSALPCYSVHGWSVVNLGIHLFCSFRGNPKARWNGQCNSNRRDNSKTEIQCNETVVHSSTTVITFTTVWMKFGQSAMQRILVNQSIKRIYSHRYIIDRLSGRIFSWNSFWNMPTETTRNEVRYGRFQRN